jgi:ubiquitin C-terminal hydrolase
MNIQLGVSRFNNIDGVSCYMVSILHILQQIPSFTYFLKKNTKKFKNDTIIYELCRAILLSLNHDNISIVPNSLKKILGQMNSMWSDFEHQDSQELYSYLITKIEEECGKLMIYTPKPKILELDNNYLLNIIAINYIEKSEIKDNSPIKDLLVGYLISNITCSSCGANSPSFESFYTLPLSIPITKQTNINKLYTLDECLNNFISDEQLDQHNKIKCSLCSIKNRSIKKIQIWKAPKILVIQLKRFVTNASVSKILNPVEYPIENFDITNYFHPDSPYKINAIYNLIGINIHMAFGSINAGHYVSIVKNNYDNEWYLFDDSKNVIKMDNDDLQNRNAYLLFYLLIE